MWGRANSGARSGGGSQAAPAAGAPIASPPANNAPAIRTEIDRPVPIAARFSNVPFITSSRILLLHLYCGTHRFLWSACRVAQCAALASEADRDPAKRGGAFPDLFCRPA